MNQEKLKTKRLSLNQKQILKNLKKTSKIMEALQVLRRGVQHNSSNFYLLYKYKHFINDLLIVKKKKKQMSIKVFFRK